MHLSSCSAHFTVLLQPCLPWWFTKLPCNIYQAHLYSTYACMGNVQWEEKADVSKPTVDRGHMDCARFPCAHPLHVPESVALGLSFRLVCLQQTKDQWTWVTMESLMPLGDSHSPGGCIGGKGAVINCACPQLPFFNVTSLNMLKATWFLST